MFAKFAENFCGRFHSIEQPQVFNHMPHRHTVGRTVVLIRAETIFDNEVFPQAASRIEQDQNFALRCAVTQAVLAIANRHHIRQPPGFQLYEGISELIVRRAFELSVIARRNQAARQVRNRYRPAFRREVNRTALEPRQIAFAKKIGNWQFARQRLTQEALRPAQAAPFIPDRTMQFALRRSQNVHWQALDVTAQSPSDLKGHRASVLWLTGLSGSGKSTIANRVEAQLHAHGVHTFLLDGDNVRHGLNHDLGFTDADRVENVRRIAEVSRLMADAGLIVLVSFISPFRAERQLARERAGEGRFVEIFVDTPLAEAEARDVKGLYAKARRGDLKNFTGIDSPYEAPENPEVRIDTLAMTPDQAADTIIQRLRRTKIIP